MLTYDYAAQQRKPGKHIVGIGIVVLMHILLGWALVSGLARKVVEVIKNPIGRASCRERVCYVV